MTDIFISYHHEDRPQAQELARALESRGWSVFWDRRIPIGKTWLDTIGRELEEAGCVIVLWSKSSIKSDWVREEADHAKQRRVLFPVLIDKVMPPIGFRGIQTADLVDWDTTKPTENFYGLISDLGQLIGPKLGKDQVAKSQLSGDRTEDAAEVVQRFPKDGSSAILSQATSQSEAQRKIAKKSEPSGQSAEDAHARKPQGVGSLQKQIYKHRLFLGSILILFVIIVGFYPIYNWLQEDPDDPRNYAIEQAISKPVLATIQANLCVPQTAKLDNETREAIRQAKIGANQSAAAASSRPFNNTENGIKSPYELQIFYSARDCSKDSSGSERGYATAFEKFRFSSQAAIRDFRRILVRCGTTLADSDAFDQPMRTAIATIKAKASREDKERLGDGSSGKLNGNWYEYIMRTCL
jgi:hypothetical protein